MTSGLRYLLSTALGAAAMYYFDPARGRYRRALVRDQLVHLGHRTNHSAGVVARDSRNRVKGLVARMRSLLDRGQPDDSVLVERVRSCIGRVVSHPHAIKVQSHDGVITLTGPVLAAEVPLLIDDVLGVPGVRDVRNQLDVHAEPGRVPALQGGIQRRPGRRGPFMQENWAPAERALGGLAGGLAALWGFGRDSLGGKLVGTAGLVLLGRAATNLELRRLLGIGTRRHAVDVQKTIRIQAPVEKVYRLWENFENFPLFMRHVRQVRRIQTAQNKERWRWSVTGPTGTEFEFDAVVVAREENELIAWRTEGEALVQHAGRVRFMGTDEGYTIIDVKMTYNPVAGAVGHVIAKLFGTDPKSQMDDDLLRMKTFLETGKLPRDAAAPAREVPEELRRQLEQAERPAARPAGGDGAARQERPRAEPLPATSPEPPPPLPG
ncbi:MAG TPA: SRPBCC family protein [Woeseiaceae bacterium]|nr:SRPBCC family protein [Woeseiaceae bacterium]